MTQETQGTYYDLQVDRPQVGQRLRTRLQSPQEITNSELGQAIANTWAVLVGPGFNRTMTESPLEGFMHPNEGAVDVHYYTDEKLVEPWEFLDMRVKQAAMVQIGDSRRLAIYTDEHGQAATFRLNPEGYGYDEPYDISEQEKRAALAALVYGVENPGAKIIGESWEDWVSRAIEEHNKSIQDNL